MSLGLLINLGLWQLDRAQQKRDQAALQEARSLEAPVSLEQVLINGISAQNTQNRKVSTRGSYWNEASFLIAFQFFQGAPGFEVLTPFELAEQDTWVLVSRGWIAPKDGGDGVPEIPPVLGEQTITALAHIPQEPVGVTQVQGEQWPLRFRRMDIPLLEQVLDRSLAPVVLRLEPGEQGVLARHWSAHAITTRSNLGYALQWFGMALIVLIVTVLLSTNILALYKERNASEAHKR